MTVLPKQEAHGYKLLTPTFFTSSPILLSFIALHVSSLPAKRALAAASLSLALLLGGGSMPANAVSGGVADFVDIHDQDLSGKKV